MAALAAGLLMAAAPAAAAAAVDPSIPPVPVAPSDGASLPTRAAPPFRVSSQPGETYLWLHVSRSPATDSQGLIDDDAELEPLYPSPAGAGLYDAAPGFYDYPGFWMNQPGTYWWQAYRISYANGADGAIEGPVHRFTLVAPAQPPAPPAPPTPPAAPNPATDPFAGLVGDPIPRAIAPYRRARAFRTSRANLPVEVAQARWQALVERTAQRWGLTSLGPGSGVARSGNFRNEVGFSFKIPMRALAQQITTTLTRYRRVRVCGPRRCRYQRRAVSRRVVDHDILVSVFPRWQQGPANPATYEYDLQTVLIHEMGHMAGNQHEPDCVDSPMVVALAPGEWWRSPGSYSWLRCGTGAVAGAASTDRAVDRRVVDVAVPHDASRAAVADRIARTVAADGEHPLR